MASVDEDGNDGDYEGAIRRALAVLDGLRALYKAYQALRSAAVKEYKHRPAEAGLVMSHIGAQLLYFARALPDYKPERPRGCPRVPRPEDLLAAFDTALRATEEGNQ
jgi:hypothetical protein